MSKQWEYTSIRSFLMPVFFAIIIMGIIQGITEFLPVSSSGHLVLLSKIFGVKESLFVSIILHVATLLSIIVVLRKKVFYYFCHPFSQGSKKIILATIPTCLIVLLIMPLIKSSFDGVFLPYCFMITAVLLVFTDLFFFKKENQVFYDNKNPDFLGISYKQAFFMGIAQGFAVFPGISRSGSTICAGMLAGGDRTSVAEFSFLMSIPVIILSLFKEVFDVIKNKEVLNINIIAIIIAFIFAFIIGVYAIKFMIYLTKKASFLWFGIYLTFIAILTLFI